MAYDINVTSSVFTTTIKRRVERIDFQRPPTEGAGSLTANAYVREYTLYSDESNPKSGSAVGQELWMITLTRDQILDVTGAAAFLNGVVKACNDMKKELEASGSVATGSIIHL